MEIPIWGGYQVPARTAGGSGHSDTPKYAPVEAGRMTANTAEDSEAGADEEAPASEGYDPESPTPPAREPPRRSTAPQSDYTRSQVAFGFVVLLIGAALTVGLPLVMG